MDHESQIELWSPNLTTFCFAGFGTAGLRREEAMKTADSENPNHGVAWPRNRAHGAVGQNRSRLIKWAEKQEKFQPKEVCFFLTSPFIELTRPMDYFRVARDSGAIAEVSGMATSGLPDSPCVGVMDCTG